MTRLLLVAALASLAGCFVEPAQPAPVYPGPQPVPGAQPAPEPYVAPDTLEDGHWRRVADSSLVEFRREGNELVGYYVELGILGAQGFQLGEDGFRFAPRGDGSYHGRIRWRRTAADAETWWTESEFQVAGDELQESENGGAWQTVATRERTTLK